jgi:hypothetical protein
MWATVTLLILLWINFEKNTIVLPIKAGQNLLIIPRIKNRVAGMEKGTMKMPGTQHAQGQREGPG